MSDAKQEWWDGYSIGQEYAMEELKSRRRTEKRLSDLIAELREVWDEMLSILDAAEQDHA